MSSSSKRPAVSPPSSFANKHVKFTAEPPPVDLASIELCCIIYGESEVFMVRASDNLRVGDLKEIIQSKAKLRTLKGIDPYKLELWKVSFIRL